MLVESGEFNSLSPNIQIQIRKTDFCTFTDELVGRICLKIKVFSVKLLLYIFSQHFLLIMYWYC